MFGAGWTEMLIIGVVALVVIGPKDLPIVMRRVGRIVGTVRRMGTEFQRELNKTAGLDQIADLRRSITEPLTQTRDEIVREFNRQTATGVEPSGVLKPADPAVESVYDQIAATSGVAADEAAAKAPPPVMKPMASKASGRQAAHLRAFHAYVAHAEQVLLREAHAEADPLAQRSAVAEWLYWKHLTGLLNAALADPRILSPA